MREDTYFDQREDTLYLGAASKAVLKSTSTAYSRFRGVANALLTLTIDILLAVSAKRCLWNLCFSIHSCSASKSAGQREHFSQSSAMITVQLDCPFQ